MTSSFESAGPPAALVAAVRRILRPLVRLLLEFGVTLPMLVEYLKSIYVEVARAHFGLPERPTTQSRISLLTGVHRKDVRRLLEATPTEASTPGSVSVGAQLVARWLADSRYLSGAGEPRALPLRAPGTDPSFEELVEAVSGKDLRGRVVLDELSRLGVVEVVDETVRLRVEGFVPAHGFDERAHYFGTNLRDHIAAAAHNVSGRSPRFLERSVSYHGLSVADVAALRQIAERDATTLLRKLNRRALAMKRRNAQTHESSAPPAGTSSVPPGEDSPSPPPPSGRDLERMNFGLFFYAENDDGNDD